MTLDGPLSVDEKRDAVINVLPYAAYSDQIANCVI